ncbi:phosphotransferase family protein [Cryptosporangium aurantiacum]|uniref:Predicted kinase, aminoglycoside phosphotransferase (APT) family n=1 Tax=Cryptosporangium aurantiacum TaxID=134849 RepID=A0A1M7TWP4_9ACTN|nr:phosphotransferase family protein [Cryptosporangium aurantiacum]SHN75125.1 Predicted kinase, aminoglycoside phosphotransferase (APT) family [Cryptosporangium aurantiacum]
MAESETPARVSKTMTTTVTDLVDLRRRLTEWLTAKTGGPAEVGELRRPGETGMSSVSLLFDAAWTHEGERVERGLVARIPPDLDAYPVFPAYDLRRQHDVIATVAAHTDVPVPRLHWLEESPDVLGSPFLVMERVEGRIPVDNPPYVFGGWLLDAGPDEQREFQDATVRLLARVHALTDVRRRLPLLAAEAGADPLRQLVDDQRAYYEWTRAADGLRIPVIEDAFAWLEEHWPADPGEAVLCWGDARPGNVIYDGFRPVAVLDWEMCVLGPREVDLAWMVFLHRFFQDIAEVFEFPGIPGLFRASDAVAVYEQASGHTVRDFPFFLMYAAVRHAVIMSRIKRRMIHFGEDAVPPTPDEYVLFHTLLRAMIDGRAEWMHA